MRGRRVDMAMMRADARARAKVIVDAMLCRDGDIAEAARLFQPPADTAQPQGRLWKELLIQSVQQQLRNHNVTA